MDLTYPEEAFAEMGRADRQGVPGFARLHPDRSDAALERRPVEPCRREMFVQVREQVNHGCSDHPPVGT
jgi:hypothetical protein